MKSKYNWGAIACEYIASNVTLRQLSSREGYPKLSTLRRQSAVENWAKQRIEFRKSRKAIALKDAISKTKAVEAQESLSRIENKLDRLIDEFETFSRHINIAKLLQSKGYEGLQNLDPQTLKPLEIVAYLKTAIEIERLTLNLATLRIDVSSLSEKELERVINGN